MRKLTVQMTVRALVFGVWSLLATLSLATSSDADDLPEPATRAQFPTPGATSVLLGRDLFFDPILSGNRNISCGTCHNPKFGSADGVALSLGEGASGLGPERRRGPGDAARRLPRNTPALFNLAADEFTTLTHDGRLSRDPDVRFGIAMPEGMRLERPLSLLAAQALLPLVAPDEMAGHPGENVIADKVGLGHIAGQDGAWQKLVDRVADIPDYRKRFEWLIGPDEPLHITDIARVLADFTAYEFRATDSPFDAFLAGDDLALNNDQLRGMALFYGKAQCDSCHAGTFQTDHSFHAIGLPQFGPGKGHGDAARDDLGRGAVTGLPQDAYRFRTPSLRNVALTAPYGHTGAYGDLGAMIRHHTDPGAGLAFFDMPAPDLLPDLDPREAAEMSMTDDAALSLYSASTLPDIHLTNIELQAIESFLEALTDPVSITGRLGAPDTVPSGLPVNGLPGDS